MLPIPVQSKILERKGNKQFRVGSCEMQGYRINMEDAHTIKLSLGGKHEKKAFFGLYDGHGSDKASLFMADKLWQTVSQMDSHSKDALARKIEALDEEFLKSPDGEKENGSTVVFVVVGEVQKKDDGPAWDLSVGNLGDSRAILIRADGKCVPLTKDHKPENESETKRIEAAGGFVRINRVDGQIAVSRAIGDVKYKGEKDKKASEQKVIAVPDVEEFVARQGDRLVLFCDGVVEKMTNEDISGFIHKHLTEMKEKKEELDPAAVLDKLLHVSLEKGSRDNMSAVMVIFDDGTGYEKKKEFIAGPFYQFAALNEEFRVAYLLDAKKHGFEGPALVSLLSQQQAEVEQRQKLEKEAAEASAAAAAAEASSSHHHQQHSSTPSTSGQHSSSSAPSSSHHSSTPSSSTSSSSHPSTTPVSPPPDRMAPLSPVGASSESDNSPHTSRVLSGVFPDHPPKAPGEL